MGWFPQRGEAVLDRTGTRFVLESELARGGQGVVFTTQADGAAVKLSLQNDDLRRARVDEQIRSVALLPIADLPVALPRTTLAPPYVGYTMTLLTGMVPARELVRRPSRRQSLIQWYRESGGLRKRLAVLASVAETISDLHARGLVYGDLSGGNVLVSSFADRDRTFLIDLDNLRFAEGPGPGTFTPSYGAPEQRTGTTQATDRFSLTVLAHELVTSQNPFFGSVLDALPPETPIEPWSSLAPWIDHPTDGSNRWPRELPRELLVPPRLRRLFRSAFTDGIDDPRQRPDASVVAIAARSALASTVTCSSCEWHYYLDQPICPECDAPSSARGYRIFEMSAGRPMPFRRCPFVLFDEGGRFSLTSEVVRRTRSNSPPALSGRVVEGEVAFEVTRPAELSAAGHPGVSGWSAPIDESVRLDRRGLLPLVLIPLGGTA